MLLRSFPKGLRAMTCTFKSDSIDLSFPIVLGPVGLELRTKSAPKSKRVVSLLIRFQIIRDISYECDDCSDHFSPWSNTVRNWVIPQFVSAMIRQLPIH